MMTINLDMNLTYSNFQGRLVCLRESLRQVKYNTSCKLIEEFNGTNFFRRICVKITQINKSKTNAIFVHNKMQFLLQSYWEAL